ncbi:MAG: Lrp/AsnC ligand binding domain-containing protein [Saprospiraceae bacterium]|nr:Lrp/AsnC ligand binding domain-containing protein [Saprospiraceae bacterium]
MAGNYEFDNLDLQILNILMKNGKTPYNELAKKLFVSGGTIHVRIKKMEQAGVILGTRLNVDHEKLGYDITCFVGVFLKESAQYEEVNELMTAIPEVVEVHYTTGVYSLFVKILCRDTTHLMEVLNTKIQKIEGIQRTETLISLKESVHRPLEVMTETY